jgi:hypothetical protein
MLYGELGRYPLNITVKLKVLSFWSKLIDGKQSKLSSLIYGLLYLKTHGNNTFSWINFVKSILDDYNLRIVSGFFFLNNDDSFNVFGLLKKYFGIIIFLSVIKFGHCNT